VTASAYSPAELSALGIPVEVSDGSLACGCDVRGCTRSAEVLIPGAAVCLPCMEAAIHHDDDGDGFYDLHLEDLVGGEDWRRVRDEQYEARVGNHCIDRRYESWDRRLDLLAADAVEELLADLSAEGEPDWF
jgi:hypothetical protein